MHTKSAKCRFNQPKTFVSHAGRVMRIQGTLAVVVCLLCCAVNLSVALDNGLGRTPQMAWNAWNAFGCTINETVVKKIADTIVATGLHKVGYEYVNLDDCWAYSRNASGFVEPDPLTFPSGIKALADYVHSLGLKFGLYSDAGTKTCAGRPGSLGYETQDAEQYASWGVDYLKYDDCYSNSEPDQMRYSAMRDALNATGRPIFFSLCNGYAGTAEWGAVTGNSWRTTTDIRPWWASWTANLDQSNADAPYAAPGGWNDPDMLEVGNGNLTTDQNYAHFSLWALAKAPLVLGNDLRNMTQDVFDVISNSEVIAISQDPLGVQGTLLSYSIATNASVFGALVYSEVCNGSPAQQFDFNETSLHIVNKLTGLLLGQFLPPYTCKVGALLSAALYIQTPPAIHCSDLVQRFKLSNNSLITNFSTPLSSGYPTLCAQAYPKAYSAQADIHLAFCNGSDPNQVWKYVNGAIQSGGNCLTVARGDEVWAVPLSDGSKGVVLFNRAAVSLTVTVQWSILGINGPAAVRDLWAHKDLGFFKDSFSATVNPTGAGFFRITPM